ncbi:MAG: sensor histidine kinase, partial [Nitrospirae bacterium]
YNATVYRDETGEVQGVFAAARDVTEHHRSERILEFENHALAIISGNPPLSAILEILCRGIEDILEGTLCSILLLDEDGIHLRLGAAPSLPGEYNRALDGMVLGPAIGSCAAAAFTGRQTIVSNIAHDLLWEDFKELALHHDLHSCWSMPIYSASGDVLGTFAVYRQIPYMPMPFDLQVTSRASHLASIAIQRSRAAQELKRFSETLELRVTEEVSKNMEQERLLIQQSRLAAMGEMIGNIAHQWRQPLNALGLLLQNTKDAYEYNELNSEYLNKSTATGMQLIAKMSSTIDDFRNFFKPNKEKTSFSLKQAVEDTLSILSASFNNHEISVQLDVADDIVAYGFPNEYSQVLLNILNNAKDAIQANKVGGGKIHIHIARHDGLASISVRDNAGGIPAQILPKIFDP